jgi:hypothetical protein
MSDWPANALDPLELVTPWSLESIGVALGAIGSSSRIGTAVSAAYPAANTAYFYPFSMAAPALITKLVAYNGATASGNLDLGIYAEDGTRLVSAGSTAQAGTNTLQVVDITPDVLIGPGVFYFAIVLDNTTGTIFRCAVAGGPAQYVAMLGGAQMASAFPLPATATLASLATDTVLGVGAAMRVLV